MIKDPAILRVTHLGKWKRQLEHDKRRREEILTMLRFCEMSIAQHESKIESVEKEQAEEPAAVKA